MLSKICNLCGNMMVEYKHYWKCGSCKNIAPRIKGESKAVDIAEKPKLCPKCQKEMESRQHYYWCNPCKYLKMKTNIKVTKLTSYAVGAGSLYDYDDYGYVGYGYRTCKHNQDKVKVGEFEVWCSEYPDINWKREKPDYGIYLSPFWIKKVGGVLRNNHEGPEVRIPYPSAVVEWEDYGVVDLGQLYRTVQFAVKKVKQGSKLEIACYGGHGRTGTLLACIMTDIENITPKKAVTEVRNRYCVNAIETVAQEELVAKYYDMKVNKDE